MVPFFLIFQELLYGVIDVYPQRKLCRKVFVEPLFEAVSGLKVASKQNLFLRILFSSMTSVDIEDLNGGQTSNCCEITVLFRQVYW